ncbi:DUF523 domain-containing protein [Sporolactobacillus pectinivorans]|uniref:DUF523 domain-containing protein n=1 Tax=Sporolactobacillus pectinivorans TaxID=1591408 RepID=UPI000C25EFB6|nr:DUF523 domain-containing protein [Sporolactobacillus pectinivorans]
MILVSSCLAGYDVRYNGTHCLNDEIRQMIREGKATAVCPELLAGFAIPREPAEIIGGDGDDVLDGRAKVIEKSGKDVTNAYIKGANAALRKAQEINATTIVLKEYSPSCGSSMIYNGKFNGERVYGIGVTAAWLRKNGIKVFSEEQISEVFK